MTTISFTETLVVTRCHCGVALAIPQVLEAAARETRKTIYCPLGHGFVYGATFQEKLERERKRHEATRDLLRAEERSHVATRGHLTRARTRAAAGVCPCCKRHFANVQRHVESQHPGFDPAGAP